MMLRILTLNEISGAGLARFSPERYEVGPEVADPHGILVRSAVVSGQPNPSLEAVGRAGVGVDNIPVEQLSRLGIPVFNAPGANANAVKELVLAAMFLAGRRVLEAWDFARGLEGDATAVSQSAETGKKQFVGFELRGKTLGVVGLGAVGVEVANAALGLGMRVIGFDSAISTDQAHRLSSGVPRAGNVEALFADADLVTLHVPLDESTRGMVGPGLLAWMKRGGILLNFAREAIVDEPAVRAALDSGVLARYLTDFPTPGLAGHPGVIALPHLGASTGEAEENSAAIVVDNMRAYLEEGNIRQSVNFPTADVARSGGDRLAICNANVPGMLSQISTVLAERSLNIIDMFNASRGDVAYTLVDVAEAVEGATFERIRAIEGVLRARLLRG